MRFFKKKEPPLTLKEKLCKYFADNLNTGDHDFGLTTNNGIKYNFDITVEYDIDYKKKTAWILYENFSNYLPEIGHKRRGLDDEKVNMLWSIREHLLTVLLAKQNR